MDATKTSGASMGLPAIVSVGRGGCAGSHRRRGGEDQEMAYRDTAGIRYLWRISFLIVAPALVAAMLSQPVCAGETVNLWVLPPIGSAHCDLGLRATFNHWFWWSFETPKIAVEAEDAKQLRRVLERLRTQGKQIRRMIINAHGNPTGSTIIDSDSIPDLYGLSDVFAPGAEIIFYSCNVGEGLLGGDFIERLGLTLLWEGGGKIFAPRGLYHAIYGSWAGYREYIVRPGGGGELREPIDLPDEIRRILKRANTLSRQVNLHRSFFNLNDPNQLSALNFIDRSIARALSPNSSNWDISSAADADRGLWYSGYLYDSSLRPFVNQCVNAEEARLREEHNQEVRERGARPGDCLYELNGGKICH